MRAIPADQLDYEYTRLENEIGFFTAPVVDGLDGILPANPLLLVQNRRPMPYLLGTTKSEFLGNELEETEEYATPLSLLLACKKALVTWKIRFGKIRQNVKDCFKEYAFKAITDSNSPGVFNWSAAIRQVKNDNEIFWPVYADASTMRDTGGTVYLYSFDYVKNNSDSTTPHAIDLTYILGLHTFPFDERDKKIQQIILALLINFVKTSNPTPMPVSGVTWIPVAFPNGRNYLSIDDKLQMKPFYYENRLLHRTALSDAFQITGQPGNFRSRKFQNAELNLTGLPSDAAIQMMLKIMYEEMEHDGHSISTNASEARSQWQSFKPWFNGSQQSEVIFGDMLQQRQTQTTFNEVII
uniref:COesterase domain-containing protein n=1 Tax=Trichuris muris TaxID=70415 RepID=A0A5S6Q031_TRIMR